MSRQLETFKKARELIARPGGWIQNSYARTDDLKKTYISARDATCFCSLGAIYRVGGTEEDVSLLSENVELGVAFWNDSPDRTQEEVVEAFDKVISKLEEETTR